MNFAAALRNGIALGLGNAISFGINVATLIFEGYILTENGDFLVQENGDKLLLD